MGNLTLVDQGTFLSDGTSKKIDLPAGADYIKVINVDAQFGIATPGRFFQFETYPGLVNDGWLGLSKDDGNNQVLASGNVISNPIIYRDKMPEIGPPVAGTAITAADPAVATSNAHGFSSGDRVLIINPADMEQIGGWEFTIDVTGANTYALEFLDASGFADPAGAFTARLLPKEDVVNPSVRLITGVTLGAQTTIVFSVTHEYVVDQLLQVNIPEAFGAQGLNGKVGKIVAVNPADNSVTLDIDSSGAGAFAFPAAGAVPVSFPHCVPAGQKGGYSVVPAYRSGNFVPYMILSAGAQAPAGLAGEGIFWQAWRTERFTRE
jgi:hypothetical protein